MTKRIVVSSDHAGFQLKQAIKGLLQDLGYQVEDVGAYSTEPVDYPEYTRRAAEKVASGEYSRGIVFCGTGQGDAMVANKVPGVRAALCWDTFTAELSREHNDANVLVLGGWITGEWLAREIVRVWLTTPFDGGRHQRRLEQMQTIEHEVCLRPRKVYDVTIDIRPGMLVWPGTPELTSEAVKAMARGDPCDISLLHIGTHTGTHIDAPAHFIPGGSKVGQVATEVLLGRARLVQVPEAHHIDRRQLERLDLKGVTRLLLGTRNSALLRKNQHDPDYAFITEDAAHYLVETEVELVGIDYLSIEEYQRKNHPAHHILLGAGVIVLEGLDLTDIPPGDYELLCLPLKLEDGDGAPARVLLREL
ncbi:MAG: ribose 5-phosphate isomerase B [Chloroflexota bacterium]